MREAALRRWTPQERERFCVFLPIEVVELYTSGLTSQEIADRFNSNRSTVCKFLRRHGVILRRSGLQPGKMVKEKHPNWSGNKATYDASHQRVHKALGLPKYCSNCGTTDPAKLYHWANQNGRYEDLTDYVRMCATCHRKQDAERRRVFKAEHGHWPDSVEKYWEEQRRCPSL
jgi:hypothetical protein